jgi:hypothetical protein
MLLFSFLSGWFFQSSLRSTVSTTVLREGPIQGEEKAPLVRDLMKVSPLKILSGPSRRGLGQGNLGVLMAQAGVGKTACLIHIALEKILRQGKLVHISLEDIPEKISSYYHVISEDLATALGADDVAELRGLLEKNRMIMAYLNQSFDVSRLRENMKNLAESIAFVPNTLIIDGLDFGCAPREVFEELKDVAAEYKLETWLSALSSKRVLDGDDGQIPSPCTHIKDLLSIVIELQPTTAGVFLRLLKDHETPVVPPASVKLDPNTFLAMT